MKFTLFVIRLNEESMNIYKNEIQTSLAKIKNAYVEIFPGFWIMKTKEAYATLHHLMHLLQRRRIHFVVLPIGDTPPSAPLSEDVAQSLEELGVEVYNATMI